MLIATSNVSFYLFLTSSHLEILVVVKYSHVRYFYSCLFCDVKF